MESKTFTIPNISCHHCTRTVENELGDLDGVTRVSADVESRQVTVEWQAPASWEAITALLDEINYPVAPETA